MNLFIKYLNFDYGSFILPLILKGRYCLVTYDDSKIPIVSTTFYIDGDALNEVNMVDNTILADLYPDKLKLHWKIIEQKTASIHVLSRHIQAITFAFFSALPLVYQPMDQIYLNLGISGVIGLIIILIRKLIVKYFIKAVGKIFRTFTKSS